MNTNDKQMALRCPNSENLGRYDIPDYKLVFRTHADIEYSPGNILQTVLWDITPECEKELDILEGFPFYYKKLYVPIKLNNRSYTGMLYFMEDKSYTRNPSELYLDLLREGYYNNGLDLEQLYQAIDQTEEIHVGY